MSNKDAIKGVECLICINTKPYHEESFKLRQLLSLVALSLAITDFPETSQESLHLVLRCCEHQNEVPKFGDFRIDSSDI